MVMEKMRHEKNVRAEKSSFGAQVDILNF